METEITRVGVQNLLLPVSQTRSRTKFNCSVAVHSSNPCMGSYWYCKTVQSSSMRTQETAFQQNLRFSLCLCAIVVFCRSTQIRIGIQPRELLDMVDMYRILPDTASIRYIRYFSDIPDTYPNFGKADTIYIRVSAKSHCAASPWNARSKKETN